MSVIQLRNVRLAFPNLFTPSTVNGEGEPAFSASFLMSPTHPQVKEIEAAIEAVARDKWGAKAEAVLKQLRAIDKTCLHDGDTKSQYAGYAGNLFVSARSPQERRPLVIDRDKSPLVAADGRIYAGCYVNASIEVWAQENSYGKRINANVRGVQFYADGDAFGGGSVADADEFDDLGSGIDAGAMGAAGGSDTGAGADLA